MLGVGNDNVTEQIWLPRGEMYSSYSDVKGSCRNIRDISCDRFAPRVQTFPNQTRCVKMTEDRKKSDQSDWFFAPVTKIKDGIFIAPW